MPDRTVDNDDRFNTLQARHVRQCLSEAKMALGIWLVGLVHCLLVIIRYGYLDPQSRPDVPPLVLGMPAWVFWGVMAPWFVQIGLTWWFAAVWLKDDEPYVDFPMSADEPAEKQPPPPPDTRADDGDR